MKEYVMGGFPTENSLIMDFPNKPDILWTLGKTIPTHTAKADFEGIEKAVLEGIQAIQN